MKNEKICTQLMIDAVANAKATFAKDKQLNEEFYDCLLEYCDAIDSVASRACFHPRFRVEIHRRDLCSRIDIISADFFLEKVDRLIFSDLAKRAVFFEFGNLDGELVVTIVFPNLWVHPRKK